MTRIRRAVRSSRGRMVLCILLSIAAVAVVMGAVTGVAVRDRFTRQLDADLRDEMRSLSAGIELLTDEQLAAVTEVETFGDSSSMLVAVGGGHPTIAVPSGETDRPDPLPDLSPSALNRIRGVAGEPFDLPSEDGSLTYRALVTLQPDGRLVLLGSPLDGRDKAVSTVVQVVFALGAVAAVVISAAVIGVTGWVTKPLASMIDTAEAIGAGGLDERVPTDGVEDVARLAAALNSMLDRLQSSVAETAASEAALRRFVADASHELRTPLAAIMGYAELQRTGMASSPEQVAQGIERIAAESERMHLLVEELLLLARLDERRPVDRTSVDLGELAQVAVADARAIDPDREVQVIVAAGEVVVSGDPIGLRQAVDNLLANVRAHTPAGTRAWVRVEPEHAAVVVSVTDEGPGLGPEAAGRVFDRFFRAEPSRARPGGAGLGLAIVEAVAAAHAGVAWVETAPGAGCSFRLRLPR